MFQFYLAKQPVNKRDFADLLGKGKKSLAGYYDNYKNKWPDNLMTEFSIRGVEFPVVINKGEVKVILNGQIDKLELADSSGVTVVDYKTSKPQSRNKILGNTKIADLNYYRQLIFYKLILELSSNGKFQMSYGKLDFIEPDSSGKYHQEVFEISDAEVTSLKEIISEMTKIVTSGNFLKQNCKNSKCEYCELAKLLRTQNNSIGDAG